MIRRRRHDGPVARGLPNLLPLGFSPAVAFDLAGLASVTGETVVQVLAEPGGGTVSVPGRPGAARTPPKDGAKGRMTCSCDAQAGESERKWL